VGIRLFILSDEIFNSGKNLFASGPSLSGAGALGCTYRMGGLCRSRLNCQAVRRVWLAVWNQRSRMTRMTR
jgi:hypothetical protein